VARGVWSGVGDSESWEKDGEDGAVDCGESGCLWDEGECDLERAGEVWFEDPVEWELDSA
jgi:hypothetical protein